MSTANTIVVKVILLFRRAQETASIISNVIRQIGVLTRFPRQEELEVYLETLSADLENLLLANAIDAIKVSFADEAVEIQLVSPKHYRERDEIDLSLLEMVPVKTESLSLEMFSSNPELIRLGTMEKMEASAPNSVTILFSTTSGRDEIDLPVEAQQDWLTEANSSEIERASVEDLIDFLS